MNISFRNNLLILIILFIITYSCQKAEYEFKIKKDKISGYVQKGPYINGTSIQMFEMDSSLTQTGKVFNTQISSNRGSFEISDIELTSQYVEFLARGYYFNEIIGAISPSELTLYALSDITDITTVNVNMLTHLEKSRVEYLVSNNSTFANAKDTAQKEILAIFGFQLNEMDNSETLDISVNKNENAILLAISLILQANRSVGDLSELLAIFIADIHQDGELNSDNIKSQLRNSALELNLATIRLNLENRFNELGVSPSIPNFEQYITDFLEFTGGLPPSVSTHTATNITSTSATLNGIVNANDLSTAVTFEYGTSTYYGDTINATQNPITGHANQSVSANLTDLNPGTLYHFRIKSVNSLGTVYGSDFTFTTLGHQPTIEIKAASNVTTTSATLNGFVNANYLNTLVIFEYGTSMDYGDTINATQSPITGNIEQPVSAKISELNGGTDYHFRIKAENSLGINYSEDLVFSTLGGVPLVVTQQATKIQVTSAVLNGLVNPSYYPTVVIFEYGTTTNYDNTVQPIQNPLIDCTDIKLSINISGLSAGTLYHYRIVAENIFGKTYGEDLTFTTLLTKLTDIEGNIYEIVQIGTQVWMAENLKTTKYSDGTNVPLVNTDAAWDALTFTDKAYCWHGNDIVNKETYGALYTWSAAMNGVGSSNSIPSGVQGVCPTGWHLPSDAEWTTLITYLGGELEAGGKLKETGTIHWDNPNNGATNETGFTALSGGCRYPEGSFDNIGLTNGYWWSSTESDGANGGNIRLSSALKWILMGHLYKDHGFSIRCIKN